MTKRSRIILMIVGLLAMLLAIFLAVYPRLFKNGSTTNTNVGAQNVNTSAQIAAEQKPQPHEATPEELARSQITILSTSFTERFGTYSNDGNYQNVVDLYPFMTSSMESWAKKYVAKMLAEKSPSYEGITTRVVNTNFNSLDLDLGEAEIVVTTQRVTAKAVAGGKIESETSYQDLRLEFLKVNDEWKIDGAYWSK